MYIHVHIYRACKHVQEWGVNLLWSKVLYLPFNLEFIIFQLKNFHTNTTRSCTSKLMILHQMVNRLSHHYFRMSHWNIWDQLLNPRNMITFMSISSTVKVRFSTCLNDMPACLCTHYFTGKFGNSKCWRLCHELCY